MSIADFLIGILVGLAIGNCIAFALMMRRDQRKQREADHDLRLRQIVREELERSS